jgi:hypothetical protein
LGKTQEDEKPESKPVVPRVRVRRKLDILSGERVMTLKQELRRARASFSKAWWAFLTAVLLALALAIPQLVTFLLDKLKQSGN